MDFEEHEDQGGEMGFTVPLPPGYESAARSKLGPTAAAAGGEGEAASVAPRKVGSSIRYRECLKNHAVSIGGHALDGCGDFIAAGDEGTLDALKCAACNCHRNFHRKETDGEDGQIYNPHSHSHHPLHPHNPQFSPYYRAPPPAGYFHLTPTPQQRPLALPTASGVGIGGGYSREDEDVSNPSNSGGGGGGGSGLKKRFRTKFTPEQKDKMIGFAERLGWRIQKHDEAAVEQFCEETGVKRQVLKVWMHNNKYTLDNRLGVVIKMALWQRSTQSSPVLLQCFRYNSDLF